MPLRAAFAAADAAHIFSRCACCAGLRSGLTGLLGTGGAGRRKGFGLDVERTGGT